jgi:hypothetical protein
MCWARVTCSIYLWKPTLTLQTGDSLSALFESGILGVKQGDPLSPLLIMYYFFVDRIEKWFDTETLLSDRGADSASSSATVCGWPVSLSLLTINFICRTCQECWLICVMNMTWKWRSLVISAHLVTVHIRAAIADCGLSGIEMAEGDSYSQIPVGGQSSKDWCIREVIYIQQAINKGNLCLHGAILWQI